jgi:hypothetical protein
VINLKNLLAAGQRAEAVAWKVWTSGRHGRASAAVAKGEGDGPTGPSAPAVTALSISRNDREDLAFTLAICELISIKVVKRSVLSCQAKARQASDHYGKGLGRVTLDPALASKSGVWVLARLGVKSKL